MSVTMCTYVLQDLSILYCHTTLRRHSGDTMETRKPCYRKDDRTMRPIYCMPWKFSRVPEYAHGYFSWIF